MLTIITITKNDIQGVSRTIQSTRLLRQFYNVKQLIIDSSDQKIHQQLMNHINDDETNIEIYYQESQGIAKAFNYGIELASESWLWFLNGGDEVHPDLNVDLLDKILLFSEADVIIFSIEIFNQDNKKTITTRHPILPDLWPPTYNWIPHPGTIIAKNSIMECGKFREDFALAMDTELWLRLFQTNTLTDLVSIKIAKFYTGGISSDIIKSSEETFRLIKLHRFQLIKSWIKKGVSLFQAYQYHKKTVNK